MERGDVDPRADRVGKRRKSVQETPEKAESGAVSDSARMNATTVSEYREGGEDSF